MFQFKKNIIRNIYYKIKHSIEMSKYNDFTIAEYFRNQGALIGKDNRILVRSFGSEPFLVSIGNHCTIANNVKFLTHDGAAWIFTQEFVSLQKFGPIKILDNCFIGIDSIILGNVTIGPNSIVGAGAVVTKDVKASTIVAGNPARIISSIEKYKEKVLSMWEKQKPPQYFKNIKDSHNYSPEYIQSQKTSNNEILKKHLVDLYMTDQN